MTQARNDYVRLNVANPHISRMQAILKKYPDIRELFGPTPATALYATILIALQFGLAVYVPRLSWWLIAVLIYFVGATINHALYVVLHELTHHLVFKNSTANRLFALFLNWPLFFPSAMPFFKYHMLHHNRQSEYDFDADLASLHEARWIGKSWWKKALSLAFFSMVQGTLRPMRLKKVQFWDSWTALNMLTQVLFIIGFYSLFGIAPLLYLMFSTLFALGLHPLGARWVQEHYIVRPGQETNSYYGPLNKLCFNMGYHNEHHDFMKVAWSRLPQVRKRAPEFYDTLFYYKSWLYCLKRFIFNSETSFFDRIVRQDQRGNSASWPAYQHAPEITSFHSFDTESQDSSAA